jgi:hypothetical protein
MDALPRELVLEIFTIGCESEFSDYSLTPRGIFNWRKRHLKSFAQHVSQVCSPWRHLAHNVPSFWVTTLVFNLHTRDPISGDILRMQNLLDSSRESEIDIWFRPPQGTQSDISFEDVERWLCTRTLAPHQHRIRAIFAEPLSLVYGSLLIGQLARGQWPALRVLVLRTGKPDCILPSQPIPAPGLRYLEVNEIAWKDGIPPFQPCSTLSFIRGKRIFCPLANSTTWSLLRSHVCHLAQHLCRLKVDIVNDDQLINAPGKKHEDIELPRLSKLWISTNLSDQVIQLLNMFRTRMLEDLRIDTSVGPSADCEDFSNHALFRHVKKLTLRMPTESFPRLLNGQFVDKVEDLKCYLSVYHVGIIQELGQFHHVVKFPSLQNLVLDASATASYCNRAGIHASFFKIFDLSSVRNYIRFSAGEVDLRQKLVFPYARKLRIGELKNMKSLSLPALRHLMIPLIETQQPHNRIEELSELLKFDIPFEGLHTLQLSHCITLGNGEGILSIAPNLVNLVLSGLEPPSIISGKVYRFPIDWRGVDVHKRLPKLSVIFPPHHGVFATYPHTARAIADSVKQVVQEQKDLGGPLKSLAFSNVPSFLNLEEMFSGEVDELEIIRVNELDTKVPFYVE